MQREAIITQLARVHAPKSLAALKDYALRWSESVGEVGQSGLDAIRVRIKSASDAAVLQDVHPEWMLKILERETPRVIAILLRYIPSRQSRYILERLPPRIKERMPHFVDAFSVPTLVVQSMRRRFESHFLAASPTHAEMDSFAGLAALSFEDLPKLICDLGLHEIALAFSDADDRSIHILMKRLPESDARRLQERMHHLEDAPKALTRDAKFTILDIDVESVPSDVFLFEIGIRAFAKACGRAEKDLISALSLKLEPRVGEWLLSQAARKSGGGELGGLRQQMILNRLETLSRAGVLASWCIARSPVLRVAAAIQ